MAMVIRDPHEVLDPQGLDAAATAIDSVRAANIESALSPDEIGALLEVLQFAQAVGAVAEHGAEASELSEQQLVDFDHEFGVTARGVDMGTPQAELGLEHEREVWAANHYGDAVEEYADLDPQTRIYVANHTADSGGNGSVVGVVRVFEGGPLEPPFMGLPISDPDVKNRLAQGCDERTVEELGTAAVAESKKYPRAAAMLWRLAFRDALSKGVKTWGIIMEPERVVAMNRLYGFNFVQIGEPVDYQGGMCAAHTLDIENVGEHFLATRPASYDFFVGNELAQPPVSQ